MRDPLAYDFFKGEVQALTAWAETGEIDLCYGDEMGVSRQAIVPYGWQPVGKSEAYVPATPSGNLTTLGFFYTDNRFEGYLQQGAMSSAMLIECVDDFAGRLTKKTVLILDNASTHTSASFRGRLASWRLQGLYIQYIPAYCPELNRVLVETDQVPLAKAIGFFNPYKPENGVRRYTHWNRHKIPYYFRLAT